MVCVCELRKDPENGYIKSGSQKSLGKEIENKFGKREKKILKNLTEYKVLCPLAAWTLLKRDAELRELPRNDRIADRARTENVKIK